MNRAEAYRLLYASVKDQKKKCASTFLGILWILRISVFLFLKLDNSKSKAVLGFKTTHTPFIQTPTLYTDS